MASKLKKITFEQKLEQLSAMVELLENVQTPLDQAIDIFEKATVLSNELSEYLTKTQQKIVEINTQYNSNKEE